MSTQSICRGAQGPEAPQVVLLSRLSIRVVMHSKSAGMLMLFGIWSVFPRVQRKV